MMGVAQLNSLDKEKPMGLVGFSIFKKFKLSSLFKYEKHENKSEIVTKINQPIIFLNDIPLAREVLSKLPKSRQDNVKKILSDAQQNTETEKNAEIPEHEWLGPFLDNCKDVCSEDLQKIWSKILQGKINKKNNTSIRTMSILKKINSSEALLFNRFLKYKIQNFIYYEGNKMPIGFPTFNEISDLLEIGLINQMNNVAVIVKPETLSSGIRIGILGIYYDYSLFVNFQSKQTEIQIPAITLSKAGIELSQFVNHQKDSAYLSCLSKFLKSQNLQLKAMTRHKDLSWPTEGKDIN